MQHEQDVHDANDTPDVQDAHDTPEVYVVHGALLGIQDVQRKHARTSMHERRTVNTLKQCKTVLLCCSQTVNTFGDCECKYCRTVL